MEKEICNAVITNTKLGFEDHGFLTLELYCDFYYTYGSASCAYGGCSFGTKRLADINSNEYEYLSYPYTSELLMKILDTIGVDNWEQIKGKLIRVRTNGKPASAGQIEAIGHILENKWFSIRDFYEAKEKIINKTKEDIDAPASAD